MKRRVLLLTVMTNAARTEHARYAAGAELSHSATACSASARALGPVLGVLSKVACS